MTFELGMFNLVQPLPRLTIVVPMEHVCPKLIDFVFDNTNE